MSFLRSQRSAPPGDSTARARRFRRPLPVAQFPPRHRGAGHRPCAPPGIGRRLSAPAPRPALRPAPLGQRPSGHRRRPSAFRAGAVARPSPLHPSCQRSTTRSQPTRLPPPHHPCGSAGFGLSADPLLLESARPAMRRGNVCNHSPDTYTIRYYFDIVNEKRRKTY